MLNDSDADRFPQKLFILRDAVCVQNTCFKAKDRKVTVGQISLADWSDRTKAHV